jgi:hypothetical protein
MQPQIPGIKNIIFGYGPSALGLAKATGGAEIAADSMDHLRRYIEMLFGLGTPKHLTEGDSK